MEIIAYLQSLFKEKGYNTLAVNLSLGIDNRHGMFDCKVTHRHRNEDAAHEIDGWVQWLKQKGVKRVVLFGHSRGGAQTALAAAQRNDPLVKAVVLLAPATSENTTAAAYQRRFDVPLAPLLEKARNLVSEGKGATVLTHVGMLNCRETSATADAFLSYYGQSPTLDTPYLIPKIKAPRFVIVAGNDEIVKGLDEKIAELVDGDSVQMKVLDGAGHFFRDLYADDAADAVDAFLQDIEF